MRPFAFAAVIIACLAAPMAEAADFRFIDIPADASGPALSGGDGVLPEDGATIDRRLPARPEYHVVADSAHFAFITPCSAEASKALPEVCVDAGAFDRVAFHTELNAAVLAFFRQHLTDK